MVDSPFRSTAQQTESENKWNGHQSTALFTFDLDAEQLWRGAAALDPDFERFTFRGTYGAEIGVPRILEVFEKHDCKCTFFVPGRVAEDWPSLIQRIHEEGHEVAHHTYSHGHPRHMEPEEEVDEFMKTVDLIEDLTGEPPRGYRGGHSEQTLSLLEEVGMIYDTSLQDNDIPYDHPDADLVELPNCFMLDDFVYWGYNIKPQFSHQSGITPNGPVFDTWQAEFDGLHQRGRMFMLTMHPQVIGRAGRIDALDDLVEHVVETGDTWVPTCAELAQHWRESSSAA